MRDITGGRKDSGVVGHCSEVEVMWSMALENVRIDEVMQVTS